jgi:hypothetical protein
VLPKDIKYVVTPFSKTQMKLDAPAMTSDKKVIDRRRHRGPGALSSAARTPVAIWWSICPGRRSSS